MILMSQVKNWKIKIIEFKKKIVKCKTTVFSKWGDKSKPILKLRRNTNDELSNNDKEDNKSLRKSNNVDTSKTPAMKFMSNIDLKSSDINFNVSYLCYLNVFISNIIGYRMTELILQKLVEIFSMLDLMSIHMKKILLNQLVINLEGKIKTLLSLVVTVNKAKLTNSLASKNKNNDRK